MENFSNDEKAMKVLLHEPTFGEEEIEAAVDQMRTTKVTMGKQVREFETKCASHFGAPHALMCNSGSSANLLAFAALANPSLIDRLRPGDEVIVPALSWATSVWPIIQHGLVPVFVDCDPYTLNFDYDKLYAAITPQTKAIMVVHVYGNPCNMDIIMHLAQEHDLYVIEDTCESMGAQFHGKFVGTLGHIGTMSLYFSHHITTFEGGLCFTKNKSLLELMRVLRAHGWSRESDFHEEFVKENPDIDPRFIFVNIGYNLRPTEVQAVIGMKQLPKLPDIIANRRWAHDEYRSMLGKHGNWLRFQEEEPAGYASWFGFCMTISEKAPFTLNDITTFLQSKGIETRPIIAGNIARHPALRMYPHRIAGSLEACDAIMRRGFAIGCHQAIKEEHIKYVGECVKEFMKPFN